MVNLEETFDKLTPHERDVLTGLAKQPMRLGFAILHIARTQTGQKRFSADQISEASISAGINLSSARITKAFNRAGDRIASLKTNGVVEYQLMELGFKEISELFDKGELTIIRFEGGKPHTAKMQLKKILANLSGDVKILDIYYGSETLTSLAMIPPSCGVQFLSKKADRSKNKFDDQLDGFRSEYPNIELRLLSGKASFHDRYILTETSLILLGHGIKDSGKSESFVIEFPRSLVEDIANMLETNFENNWQEATLL